MSKEYTYYIDSDGVVRTEELTPKSAFDPDSVQLNCGVDRQVVLRELDPRPEYITVTVEDSEVGTSEYTFKPGMAQGVAIPFDLGYTEPSYQLTDPDLHRIIVTIDDREYEYPELLPRDYVLQVGGFNSYRTTSKTIYIDYPDIKDLDTARALFGEWLDEIAYEQLKVDLKKRESLEIP